MKYALAYMYVLQLMKRSRGKVVTLSYIELDSIHLGMYNYHRQFYHDIYSKKLHSTQTIHGMFFDRNISMFTLLANNLARCGSTMYPPELNTPSDGMLVPQIHRYFLTSTESNGNLLLFCFHQSKGSLLVSSSGRSQ